ncbi:serine hydrolase domain-containing protein [Catenuloplanes indicus]|uniref:D-alanyl-D-alanine carboxypeptidase n=1 Tax=Catenuloplanes indicus TaxID=137267 RepID=A0AAE3VYJ6_9ACTN|nr:serine hydrolase domain-containing protein [Catenuloplanes indicus]MDQ0366101.1 D-alanyl-D-alanine carboxypeptidase [Catenuloplanes indicus]
MSNLWRHRGPWPAVVAAVLAGIAVLAPAGAATAAPKVRPGPLAAEIQPFLDTVTGSGVPGAYVQVRRDGRTFDGASGVAFVASGTPARADFRHRIGSVTKSFVSTAVLQLVGERRLSLDTSVDRLLPRFELDPRITVRQLLAHTSGIGNHTSALTYETVPEWQTRTFTPDELVRLGQSFPATGAPGERFSYSNTNYILAGLIIEKVTGNDVAKEISRRILEPLGLRDTYFPGSDPRIRGPHAGAYLPWPDPGTGEVTLRDFSVYNMTWIWTAGDMVSTMDDLNTFYRALFTGRLLRPVQQRALLAGALPMIPEAPDAVRYGLGVYAMQLPCGTFYGHDGAVIGYVTQVLTSADGRTQVAAGVPYGLNFGATPEQAAALNGLVHTAACGPQAGASADQRRASAASDLPLLPAAMRLGVN